MKAIRIIPVIVLIILISRCYYDSEEFLYPDIGNNCDTTQVTYSLSVVPVIQNNCLACHSNSTAAAFGGNVRLEDYADIKAKADDGKLLGTITHAGGFVPMPQGAAKLDNCTIALIRIWIDAGAPNN